MLPACAPRSPPASSSGTTRAASHGRAMRPKKRATPRRGSTLEIRGSGVLSAPRMQVHVARAEIWTLPVDAVVNPANSMGIMGGGISGSLRRHGGDVIQQAAMSAAPIAVGAAIVTTAGQLPSRHVIHVPTMEEPGMKISAENVRRAARAALIASDINQFKVIAIPGIGTDLNDVPIEEAV